MTSEVHDALKQVTTLIGDLQVALKDPAFSQVEKKQIRQAVKIQMDMQNTLIFETMQAMVDKINSANGDLQTLMTKMESTSAKLARLAAAIKKVADVVGIASEATAQTISKGLLGGA